MDRTLSQQHASIDNSPLYTFCIADLLVIGANYSNLKGDYSVVPYTIAASPPSCLLEVGLTTIVTTLSVNLANQTSLS